MREIISQTLYEETAKKCCKRLQNVPCLDKLYRKKNITPQNRMLHKKYENKLVQHCTSSVNLYFRSNTKQFKIFKKIVRSRTCLQKLAGSIPKAESILFTPYTTT